MFLVRHGAVDNPRGLVYGRLPGFGLSPDGVRQAEVAADLLSGFDVQVVMASPQERAVQTAKPIADRHGRTVLCDVRLAEVLNRREGLPFLLDPTWKTRSTGITLLSPHPFPDAVETQEGIRRRMCAALASAAQRVTGDIVLVSHQVPLAILIRSLGIGEEIVPDLSEGAIIMLESDGEQWAAGIYPGAPKVIDLPESSFILT